jgi:predicted AlkP superfamily phosphohydrolase/phosphomutase
MVRRVAALVALATLALAVSSPHGQPARPGGRVILLSIDSGADWLVDRLIETGKAPAFAALRREGVAAEGMIGAFPSFTAVAHATLWTGAWSRTHGISGNSVSLLPRATHTILEWQSGFDSEPLEAEPIWEAAARQGRRTLVLQATGGFPFRNLYPSHLLQFDVYANLLADLEQIEGTLPESGAHRFHVAETPFALTRGDRDALVLESGAARVELQPGADGRFSPPLPVRSGKREAHVRFRLIEHDVSTGAFRLVHGAAAEITSSDPGELAALRSSAGTILHEHFVGLYRRGALGPTIAAGGSGAAERWLEELVLVNHEYFTGSLAYAASRPWDLLVLYVPSFDAVSHSLVGMLDPQSSRYSEAAAARAWPILERLFAATADAFVAELRTRFPDATVVVTADHGSEGIGRYVLPNVALREAGLLAVDARGRLDLSRTQAAFLSSKAHMIFVNTDDWRGGIVPASGRDAVKRRAAAALLGMRDPAGGGAPIRAVYDVEVDGVGLGIGGPRAGDLYFDVSPDYYPRDTMTGDAEVVPAEPPGSGIHGPAPWRRKLHAIFYAAGPLVRAGTEVGLVQGVDVAPTVAALLGIEPPRDSTGRALPIAR